VEYSLFIMVLMWKILVKVEIPPAATPTEFTPPIFVVASYVLMFLSLGGSLLEETLWVIYIGVLGQTESVGESIRRNGRSMAKRGRVARPPLLGKPPILFWASVSPS
jgi:hypothetical protein